MAERTGLISQDGALRQDLQTSPRRPSCDGMVDLLDQLVELGVGQIEVGWPGKRPDDVELIAVLKEPRPDAVVETVATVQGDGWQRERGRRVGRRRTSWASSTWFRRSACAFSTWTCASSSSACARLCPS